MNRNEFMNELVSRLDKLPKEAKYDAIKKYEKYFDEAGPENEAQVIKRLGSPSQIAKKLINNTTSKEVKNRRRGQELTFIGVVILIIGGIAFCITNEMGGQKISTRINVPKISRGRITTERYDTKDINEVLGAFENIEIESEYLEVNILEGEQFKIEGGKLHKVHYGVEGNTFVLKQKGIDRFNALFFENIGSRDHGIVNLYVPKGTNLNNVQISGGVGEITLEKLSVNKLQVEAGVGKMGFNDMLIGECNIEGGVGEIIANGVACNSLDITNGIGVTEFTGSVDGDVTIEGGVGEVILNLTGNPNQYNYSVNQGVGGITVNDVKYHENNAGIRTSLEQNNNAPYNVDIEGGLGEIEVNIKE